MTTISTLPPAPSRADPVNFAAKGDALMGALDGFVTETNLVAGEINTAASAAATSASTATTQAGIATTQAELATTNGAAQVALAADQVALATTQAGLATTNGAAQVALAADQVALATAEVVAAAASAASAVSAPGTSATSATSLTIATGSQSLTVQTGKSIVVGMNVVIAATATPQTSWMGGIVTSYTTGTGALVVNVTKTGGSGTIAAWTISLAGIPATTTLANFNDAVSGVSPNNVTYASSLTPSTATANADFVIKAKGTGALLAQVPDALAAGGNKRGTYAVDWQMSRAAAADVASGNYAVIGGGQDNVSSGLNCVVAGGYNNIAGAGNYATVAGGVNNSASGVSSSIGGGSGNAAAGASSPTISGGQSNTASGNSSVIGGGASNTASGSSSVVCGGSSNTASFNFSAVLSGAFGQARAAYATVLTSSSTAAALITQTSVATLRGSTATTTPLRLTTDQGAASTSNTFALLNSSAANMRLKVVARDVAGNVKTWICNDILIKRGASAAATSIVGSPSVTSPFGDAGLSAASVAISADTTNGALNVTVTGITGAVTWSASLEVLEVS